MAKVTELPTAGPLTGAEPVMVVQDGESRQSPIGPLVDVLAGPYAAIAEAAAAAAQAGVDRFRETIAQGVADFAVDEFFASAETGTTRIYRRTAISPFYVDVGDGAAPLTLTGGDGRYAKTEDLQAPTGGAMLTIQQEGVGAKPQPLIENLKNAGMKTPQDYDARGPGYDDTAPLHDWLNAVVDYQRGGLLLPMEYAFDETLDLAAKDLSGVRLVGVKGKSIIRGTNGIGTVLANLPGGDGFHIEGIGLVSDHVEPVRDYRALLTIENKSVRKATLRDMYFSAASSHVQAIFISPCTSSAVLNANRGFVDGLTLENILIDQIGGQGMTIMNRAYDEINGEARMRNLHILRPEIRGTGLMGALGTDNGLGISLDGLGIVAEIGWGLFEDLIGIGIENTGFQHTTFHHNKGRIFTRGWALVGWHGLPYSAGDWRGVPRIFKNCHSLSNEMVGDLTGAKLSDYTCLDSSCSVVGDVIGSDDVTGAVFRFCQDVIVRQSSFKTIKATATSAIFVDAEPYVSGANPAVANYNKIDFHDCEADMVASTQAGNVLLLSGATATGSRWRGDRAKIRKNASSGYVGQANGAAGNVVEPFIDETGNRRNTVMTMSAPSDADHVITGGTAAQSFNTLIYSGGVAWTAERVIDFPSIEPFRKPCMFRQAKEWPNTFRVGGVAVSASRVTPGQTVMLQANNSGTLIVTPLTAPSVRGSKTYDAPSIAAGGSLTTTVTVNGATPGDISTAALAVSPQGMTVTANISANNVSLVTILNGTTGAVDLASTTLSSLALK